MEGKGSEVGERSSQESQRVGSALSITYALLVGLTGLALLVYLIVLGTARLEWGPILLFAALSFLVQGSSFHLGTSMMHSLAGVIDLAAVLALGPVSGAAVAAFGALGYLELNALRHHRFSFYRLVEIPLFNAGLRVWIALAAGSLVRVLPGALYLDESLAPVGAALFSAEAILSIIAVSLLWFTLDHLGWGILSYLEGRAGQLRRFLGDALPGSLLIELLPLPFSVVVALVYLQQSWVASALLAVAILAVAELAQRWASARNQLVQRVVELSTIKQVGQAIAQAQLDVDEICALMYEHTRQIADVTIFHLGLFDGDRYTLRFWVREGQEQPPRTLSLTPGSGLVNWLRESKSPLLIRDLEKEQESLPVKPVYASDDPVRSALFVPLMTGDTVVGTLSIQSYRRDAYAESDLRVLSAMATQAAVAIQKAQLYDQERKRVRQLETVEQVSRQVAAILEPEELFKSVVRLVRADLGYYHVAIYSVDLESQTVTFQASSSAGERDVALEVEWGQGLIGWVAAYGEPVIVNDVENDSRYRCVEALQETRSEMAVPLLLENEQVGVLDVQSDQLGAFGPDDLFILDTLGGQFAVALQKARLYEAEQRQAWLSTALLQVAEAASRLSDMDGVLTTVVRLVPLLAGVDRCAILLWDPDAQVFLPVQTYGLAPELREVFSQMTFSPEEMPALDMVRWDPEPLRVSARRDGGLIPRGMAETFNIQEMVLLPLLAQGELLGVMMVDYAEKAHPFSEQSINMLAGIANQAATVIHSAQLVQAQREEAYVSMALLQVADTVNRSTDLQETMAAITRITPILVGVEACAIFLWDPEANALRPLQQYGLKGEGEAAFWQTTLTKDIPAVERLLTGGPFVTADELQDVALPGAEQGAVHGLAATSASVLLLPLVTRGDVVGAMLVQYGGPVQRFVRSGMNILAGIAGQAAVAVESSRLLQEAAERERIHQELEVARRIQTSFLPECCPSIPGWELAVVWRSARQVGGDFYDFIPLPPGLGPVGDRQGRTGVVVADVADKGVPAALFMALSRTLVRTMAIEGRPPDKTVALANDLILADTRAELFVTLFYAILHQETGEVTYVNAGHMPPLLLRTGDGTTEELRTDGMALGVVSGIEFEACTTHLEAGDTLIFYTDGVVEASNVQQEMFGRERLIEAALAHRDQAARDVARTIDEAIAVFVGDASQFDDLTLVVAKRLG